MNDLMKPIFTYTSQDAEEDGLFFNITKLNKEWEKGLLLYVTTNLLSYGYMDEKGQVKIPNLLDLLNQCNKHLVSKLVTGETLYDLQVEFPNGVKRLVFIALNEVGKFTIMLPEDY